MKEQKCNLRKQKFDLRGQKCNLRGQKSNLKEQKFDLRKQKSDLKEQKSDLRKQKCNLKRQKFDPDRLWCNLKGQKWKYFTKFYTNHKKLTKMINLQERKLQMYLTLRALLRAYPEVLTKLPNGEEYLSALDGVILIIQNNIELKQKGTTSISNQQKEQKAQLKSRMLEDSLKLKAYANYQNNAALIEFCSTTDTKLGKLNDTEFVVHAKSLYGYIGESLPGLSRYQLSPETQASLLDLVTGFELINPALSNAKGSYKNLSYDLIENFKEADAIVAKLDIEIELIKSTDTAVYNIYRTKRKPDYNPDTNDLVGHVLDAETGAGLPNATLTFTLNGSTAAPIVKTSAEKGGFQIKTIAPGIYTVTITKIGYQTQTLPITIIGDDQFSLEVKLVRG